MNSDSKAAGKLYPMYLALFVTVLLVSNIIAGKLVQFGPIVLTAATFLFPISYIFGDVLTEVYGYAGSRKIIWLGFGANVFMSVCFIMAIALPHPGFWKGQEGFAATLGVVPRIVAASMVAYLVGEFVNSFVLARMKEWMVKWDPKHRHLWMRTIGSTLVGEGADTVLFVFLAFAGTIPWSVLWGLMFWQWILKCSVEIVFTPLTYVVVGATKKAEGLDVVGADSYSPFKVGI